MVLEDLIPAQIAEKKPIYVFPLAILYASLALFFALWIFPSHAAILAVVFTTLLSMPLFWGIVDIEKHKQEITRNYLKYFLPFRNTHNKVLHFFGWLFLGLTIATAAWFVLLPNSTAQNLFYIQLNTIKEINIALSGGFLSQDFFLAILGNNLRVLLLTILFSFIFGAGAMFILVWNASVIGVAIGGAIRSSISITKVTGLTSATVHYTSMASTGFLRYWLHGMPEILAYFVGALAGAMLSIAVVKQELQSSCFKKTLRDVIGLILIAVGLLLIAGAIEVTISPLLA